MKTPNYYRYRLDPDYPIHCHLSQSLRCKKHPLKQQTQLRLNNHQHRRPHHNVHRHRPHLLQQGIELSVLRLELLE